MTHVRPFLTSVLTMDSWATMQSFELLRRGKSKHRPTLHCMLDQYLNQESNIMRTVFTIEVSTDINVADDKRRAAFIELMRKASKQLYAQTAMLSDRPSVEISIQADDSINGCKDIPVFDKDAQS